MNRLLVDTHALLWLVNGDDTLGKRGRDLLEGAATLMVSPISVWEIGMLVKKNRIRLGMPVQRWVDLALAIPGIRLAPISAAIALECSQLPEPLHPDPADRFLVATSRLEDIPLATRDQRLIDYGLLGHASIEAL